MSFDVTNAQTAAALLDRFNGFHDGFMQRIAITSRARIEADRSQTCSGRFDVEIDFAHYNYASDTAQSQRHDQIICGQFRDVRDIRLELTGDFAGNTIISLTILATADGLELRLGRHAYLAEERRYDYREATLFTFATATFSEL